MKEVSIEEKEFLSNYNLNDYPRPSVTSDIVLFSTRNESRNSYRHEAEKKLCVLLIQRGEHPFQYHWALAGGFLQPDETIEVCAARELQEETGAVPSVLEHIGVFSQPDRDPRGWIISNAFLSVLSEEKWKHMRIVSSDDAISAKWFDISLKQEQEEYLLTLQHKDILLSAKLKTSDNAYHIQNFEILENDNLAFDHAKIITKAMLHLRKKALHFELLFDFLPEYFTLTELQKIQEMIIDKPVLTANFRRKISGYVTQTEQATAGAGHRPAKLFRKA